MGTVKEGEGERKEGNSNPHPHLFHSLAIVPLFLWPKLKIPFLGLSLLCNLMEKLAWNCQLTKPHLNPPLMKIILRCPL